MAGAGVVRAGLRRADQRRHQQRAAIGEPVVEARVHAARLADDDEHAVVAHEPGGVAHGRERALRDEAPGARGRERALPRALIDEAADCCATSMTPALSRSSMATSGCPRSPRASPPPGSQSDSSTSTSTPLDAHASGRAHAGQRLAQQPSRVSRLGVAVVFALAHRSLLRAPSRARVRRCRERRAHGGRKHCAGAPRLLSAARCGVSAGQLSGRAGGPRPRRRSARTPDAARRPPRRT